METLPVTKEKAIVAYNGADESGKKLLADLFGKSHFIQHERIKTLEEACEYLGLPILKRPFVSPSNPDERAANAFFELTYVIRARNGGWIPNYKNSSEQKWFPVFDLSNGVRFSGSNCNFTRSYTLVGSRLCFKTETASNISVVDLFQLYVDLLTA